MTQAAAVLGLGDPYHVGIAVWDLDESMDRLSRTLGVERWGTLQADVPSIYRGAETVVAVRSAYARSGSIYLELVQPAGGAFTAQTFLDERGEGIYHLGYWADDIVTALTRADALGIGVDWRFPATGDPLAVYLDATPTLGVHIELVSPAMRPIIEQAIANAERRGSVPAPPPRG